MGSSNLTYKTGPAAAATPQPLYLLSLGKPRLALSVSEIKFNMEVPSKINMQMVPLKPALSPWPRRALQGAASLLPEG